MKHLKKALLIVILIVVFPIITSAYYSCGDKYDDCCSRCFDYMLETGHSTDCYNNCYNSYEFCKRNFTPSVICSNDEHCWKIYYPCGENSGEIIRISLICPMCKEQTNILITKEKCLDSDCRNDCWNMWSDCTKRNKSIKE